MKFYSGFSLKNEEYFFNSFIKNSEYTVCGFSYGAIEALNRVADLIKNKKRVDTLQLFSPIFFQNKDTKFIRLQMIAYNKDKSSYMKQFTKNSFAPYKSKEVQHTETNVEELKELLEHKWSLKSLEALNRVGVKIEVYLGGKDKIVDTLEAKEFFVKVATVTYIKSANHFLQLD